jgi:hypothetical protein
MDAETNSSRRRVKQPSDAPSSGNSFFLPAVIYGTGDTYAYSVAVADVNRDGKPDLLVANGAGGAGGSVGVLLGNGDGTFKTVVKYYAGGNQTSSVAVSDLNGDGMLDLVVANSNGTNNIGVLLGNGDGTFRPVVTYSSGGGAAESVWIADVNEDGKRDILVAVNSSCTLCTDGGLLAVLLGNGDGTFQPAVMYSSGGYNAHWVAAGDLNGDGKLDLVVANRCGREDCVGDGSIGVLLGNGNGTFQIPVVYDSGGLDTDTVAIAEVNGDGRPDLVVAINNCISTSECALGTVGVLLGNGNGAFQPALLFGSGGYSYASAQVADVNGDGVPDIVVTNLCASNISNCAFLGTGSVGVLLGYGDGTFQPVLTYDSGAIGADSVAAVDVNGDGQPDLLVTSLAGEVSVLLHSGATQAPTTTTLTSLQNPSVFGQTITFIARVNAGSGTPTGIVKILDGAAAVGSRTLQNGSVSIAIASLTTGPHSITAAYQGSAGFAPSTSAPLTQTVTAATTAANLTSSLNPAGTNQSVTFTATVTSQYGGAVTGSVTFSSGSQTLGTASLSGNAASLNTSFSTTGTYSISAKYNGDGNNSGSSSSNLREVILAATTTTLVSSLNPSLVGQAVTFTATVSSSSGPPPNGETVTFKNGSAVLGTAPLSGGKAALTTSTLAAGIYTITASYPGDSNFAASTSPGLRQVVNSTTKSATATTLVSSLNPSVYGQKVTWTATVTTSGSVRPTGTVNFTWGHSIGSATLSASGVATLTKSNLNADTYPLTAVYGGDVNNLSSTSPVVTQVITQATTSATLTSSPNPSTFGQAVTFTATITSPTVIPTGPVTFAIGKTVLGTAQLTNGKANFTTSTLAVGSTKVTATYNGNSNIAKSSASVTQTVH